MPKNVPAEKPPEKVHQEWGWKGIDHLKAAQASETKPKLRQMNNLELDGVLLHKFFEMFFFGKTFIDSIIEATNTKLAKKIDHIEFLVYIGIWLLMSIMKGHCKRENWSTKPVSLFEGAPVHFSDLTMPYYRFL